MYDVNRTPIYNARPGADPGKGVHMYRGVGVRFADFISFVLMGPNYFIFIGYLKTCCMGMGCGLTPEPPLDPPLTPETYHI